MPLVHSGPPDAEPTAGGRRERARKIHPEYARGQLVRVAGGRNQAEAELIQNLLLEEGVPSMLRRSAGFDVPDFLAAGPRDVLVPESGAEPAAALLGGAGLVEPSATRDPRNAPSARRAGLLAAAIGGGGVLCALLAWSALQI
jgi:hypothetical protein